MNRLETYEERQRHRMEEAKKDLEGWKYELKGAERRGDKRHYAYCSWTIKILRNTINIINEQLKNIKNKEEL